MLFNSTIFLFLFLPVVLLIYYLVPQRFKNFILFISSLFFYAWGENKIVLVMIASTLVDFSCGLLIEQGKRRLGLLISIITNLSFLGFFKYFNFTFDNFNTLISFFGGSTNYFENLPHIALPIGISFYTFQTMSYTIDVYRGHVNANRNFIDFATYVTMFPQLIAGPIVRYIDIDKQLRNRRFNYKKISEGVEQFIIGLAKKTLIANTFAAIADDIFAQNINDLSTFYAWFGIIAYAFHIYFDFSAYSDMAIGLGKFFGFDFLENFNYPYISKSIRDFWRRWHISLSTWFRDYLYISLGGNRLSKYRTYINLCIVFFITGLWHGASWNFVIWGLFHGFFIIVERMGFNTILNKIWVPFQHLYALIVVLIGWVFFRADTLTDAFLYLHHMFVFTTGDAAVSSYLSFFHINFKTLFFLISGVLFSMPVYNLINQNFFLYKYTYLRLFSLIILFLTAIIYISTETYNPFIYFRF